MGVVIASRAKGALQRVAPMIFVITGTQKFSFNRLLEAVDRIAQISDYEFIVQSGHSTYKPKYCKSAAFYCADEFKKLISSADVVITHAGVGSMIECLSRGKRTVAVPRLSRYKEHVDDHQQELAQTLADGDYLVLLNDAEELSLKLDEATKRHFKKYEHRESNLVDDVIKKDQ